MKDERQRDGKTVADNLHNKSLTKRLETSYLTWSFKALSADRGYR